jgi:transposase
LETDPTRMCELLVGLPDVTVTGVGDWPGWLRIAIETRRARTVCGCCGTAARGHGRREVVLVDLPVFGRAARLVWSKQRWRCANPGCPVTTWTEQDPRIASTRLALTGRAARWVTLQVGRHGRSVAEVAADLGCDWHTVMDAVVVYGEILIADPDRFGAVTAVGLDETLFAREGPFRTQAWSTQVVDVGRGQLLDIVEGRDAAPACAWFAARPQAWRDQVRWATLDLSNAYRAVFDTMLPDAIQVADPFHVVKLANSAVDECRRRVQNETLGHRGRKDDPLYRCRKLLVMADERVSDDGRERLRGLLAAGDPKGELKMTWHAKEVVRQTYDHTDVDVAAAWVDDIVRDFTDSEMPFEVRRLGRTIRRWRDQIIAWHRSHVSNGPTEAVNNLVKRVKRTAFGFKRFKHYRIRALLYAGRPNWELLDGLNPP